MKKVILLVAVFLTSLISCSEDDGETNPIVGKWQILEFIENSETIAANICDKQDILEIRSDGTLSNISFPSTSTTDASGNTTITCGDPNTTKGTYSINGGEITSTTEGNNETFINKFVITDGKLIIGDSKTEATVYERI